MNKQEFGKFMAYVNTIFETKATTKEAIEIWFNELNDLNYEIACNAMRALTRTQSGWIYIADIRRAYDDIVNPKANIVEAYETLTNTIRLYGRYQHQKAMEEIEKKNPSMARVVKAIGYQTLCSSDLNFTRPTIERMYKAVEEQKSNVDLLGGYSREIGEIRAKVIAER